MQKQGSVKGTEGASGYAPGRSATGSKADKDDIPRNRNKSRLA
jgi:hypothetical protein